MFFNSTIYKIGLHDKYKEKYCSNGKICRMFAKPLKNTVIDSPEIARFIEYFDEELSLIKYFGNVQKITSGCTYSGTKYLTENDSDTTVTVDGIFYTNSSSIFVQKFKNYSIYFGAENEETPLARFEWIKFLSIFYGKEIEATEVFNAVEKQYNCNKEMVLNNSRFAKLRVAWLSSYSPRKESWLVPDPKYAKNLLSDAGATISTETEITLFKDLHEILKKSHFLIDSSASSIAEFSMDDIFDQYHYRLDSDLLLLTHNNILKNDATRSMEGFSVWDNDYMAFPHLVLLDMLYWFHPRLFFGDESNFNIISNFYNLATFDNSTTYQINNINSTKSSPTKRSFLYQNSQTSGYWFRNLALNNDYKTNNETECPSRLHKFLASNVCLSDKHFYGDYDDYAAFDSIISQIKNYSVLYYHIIGFVCLLSVILAFVFLKLYRKHLHKRREFSDGHKVNGKNEGFVEIIED